jgi:AcrR family transcriptional regulator
MARPERFDTEALLSAAVELVATAGPGALTMVALARAAGASSGSVYHRFESLSALQGAIWIRTVEEFQTGFLEELRSTPGVNGCARAARHVVAWSRTNPGAARVLMAGPAAFGEDTWSSTTYTRSRKLRRELKRELSAAAAALEGKDERGRRRITLATVDMPLGLVRRRSPERLDGSDEELAEAAARAMLG